MLTWMLQFPTLIQNSIRSPTILNFKSTEVSAVISVYSIRKVIIGRNVVDAKNVKGWLLLKKKKRQTKRNVISIDCLEVG